MLENMRRENTDSDGRYQRMKKYNVCFMMASIVCTLGLAGCQRAPDGVEGNGIMHAQSDMEQQMQDIAAAGPKEQTQAQAGAQPQGAYYQGTVGTGDNKINIKAEIPALPDKLHILTLKPDEIGRASCRERV